MWQALCITAVVKVRRFRGLGLLAICFASALAAVAVAASVDSAPPARDNSLSLADFCMKTGDWRGAERILRGQQGIEAKWMLANACFKQGLLQDADDALTEVLSAQPAREEAVRLRAQVSLQRGDMSGAASALRQLLMAEPKNADLHKALARCESRQGNIPAAMAAAHEAHALNPSDPEAFALLGDLAANGINRMLPKNFPGTNRRPNHGRP